MAAPTVRESIFSPETRGLTIAVMACVGIIAYNLSLIHISEPTRPY